MAKALGNEMSVRKNSVNINVEKNGKIDFLNIRCTTSKIHEFNNHLSNHDVSIFGMVETFLKTNDKPANFDHANTSIG